MFTLRHRSTDLSMSLIYIHRFTDIDIQICFEILHIFINIEAYMFITLNFYFL